MSDAADPFADFYAIDFLKSMSPDYPGIIDWYRTKVKPGLKDGTRRLFYRLDSRGNICGLGIAKNDGFEKKICTLRVTPQARGRGVGYSITNDMLKWLGTEKPHFTISETNLPKMERWLKFYEFEPADEITGLYLPKRKELIFNV